MRRLKLVLLLVFVTGTVSGNDLELVLDRLEANCAMFGKPAPKSLHSVETVTEFDSHWISKSVTTIEKKIVFKDSIPEETILRAVKREKGEEKNVTKEMIEKQRRGKSENSQSMSLDETGLFVFSKKVRAEHIFSWRADTLIGGREVKRLLAVPKIKNEKSFVVEYRVHPDSLTVLSAELTPSQNPKMVKQMAMRMDFYRDSSGHFYLQNFRVRFYINLLVKKMRIEITEQYGDFLF